MEVLSLGRPARRDKPAYRPPVEGTFPRPSPATKRRANLTKSLLYRMWLCRGRASGRGAAPLPRESVETAVFALRDEIIRQSSFRRRSHRGRGGGRCGGGRS